MPKSIDRDLLDMLRRPNPNVEYRIEIAIPDVSKVLRRPDQFINIVPGSMTPANSLVASDNGLMLASVAGTLADFTGTSSHYDLNSEDPQRRKKGLRWTVDRKFNAATLRSFTARVRRQVVGLVTPPALDFELVIYRITRVPGVIVAPNGSTTPRIEYAFTDILGGAAVVKAANITWVSNVATLTFPLQNLGVRLGNGPPDSVSPDQTAELPAYYFVVRPVKPPTTNSLFSWFVDTSSSRTITDVGTFDRVYWNRNSDQEQWQQQAFTDVPSCTIVVEAYVPTGQAVYEINFGRAPSAKSTGRFVFEGRFPRGTGATLEVSYTGPSGPWFTVDNGGETT